ncbi:MULTISPECIES: hypothetical protein [unclassified Pseudomonas]|uniref:hypothetical protein n=1 Tax=unclassified Pseudomonas TaxID=196821 RepID=UPI000D6F8CE6|nr:MULTISPECIES: hypothetical protein [unclassified Pseudomonas]MED5607698.1 hypothetical protein [Pseudomonas sp. JH-2]PWU25978.1 hypothetical protein DK254_25510 [Pseudomonas sp. RW407]
MTLLLPLIIALLLVALPRLLPLPVASTAGVPAAAAATWHACELPEPPALPRPQAGAAPSNLLYLPLGLHPADRCLHGPLVVEGLIRIRPPLQFWRISAGEIRFGDCSRTPTGIARVGGGRNQVEEGEYRVAAGGCLEGDLLVRGDLFLGRYSRVLGSVQVEGGVWMDEGAEVAGGILARGSVRVGRRSRVAGPLSAGRSISLGRDCVVGAQDWPTTVSADRVRINEGCKVYGQVLAEKGAQVNALAGAEASREPV